MPPRATPAHIPVLDGIRGLAVALVMGHHFLQVFQPQGSVDHLVRAVSESGWCGVDLFFVLSGFLITGILYDAKGSEHYWRNFYARRVLRIFPLYYAVLLILFGVLPLMPHPLLRGYVADSSLDQAWNWGYLTNFRVLARGHFYQHHLPSILWSLAIEEQFYLVWPLVVMAGGRRALMATCVLVFAGSLGLRFVFWGAGIDPLAGYVATPARMDGLALGALLALVVRGEGGLARAVPWARGLGLGAAILLVAFAVRAGGTLDWHRREVNTVGLAALAVLFGSALVLCLQTREGSWIHRLFGNAPMRAMGKYSYALYLCHGPSMTFAKHLYDPGDGPLLWGSGLPRMVPFVLLATLISFSVALLSWNLLESRFLVLKRRFQ